MSYRGYPPYVTVAKKRARAQKKLEQLKKKNSRVRPVSIQGRKIAKTWWGGAWNENLESYADYAYRLERGRSYVRHGCVLDLRVKPELVQSLVAGAAAKPYSVSVEIDKISRARWKTITTACRGTLGSMQELMLGKFPRALGEIFTARGAGLFPTPEEIRFSCTCPDWASMCKHVAATLYGIGARLDEEPGLFFSLRGVDLDGLVSKVVTDQARELLTKAGKKSGRVLEDADLSNVFGIDLEERAAGGAAKKTAGAAGTAAITARRHRRGAAKGGQKSGTGILPAPCSVDKIPIIVVVEKTIRRSRKGIGVAGLKQKTGFDEKKLYSAIQRLKTQGKIRNTSRGVYLKA